MAVGPRRRRGRRARSSSPRAAAATDANLMEATIALAKAGGTVGEWAGVLREVFGEYRAPTGVGGVAASAGDGMLAVRAKVKAAAERLGGPLRILVGKPGLDGHSNGAEQIAVAARDAGHGGRVPGHPAHPGPDRGRRPRRGRRHRRPLDPVRLAPRARPRDVAAASGPRASTRPVVVGGIIPPADARALEAAGIARVYTPKDYELAAIMDDLTDLAAEYRETARNPSTERVRRADASGVKDRRVAYSIAAGFAALVAGMVAAVADQPDLGAGRGRVRIPRRDRGDGDRRPAPERRGRARPHRRRARRAPTRARRPGRDLRRRGEHEPRPQPAPRPTHRRRPPWTPCPDCSVSSTTRCCAEARRGGPTGAPADLARDVPDRRPRPRGPSSATQAIAVLGEVITATLRESDAACRIGAVDGLRDPRGHRRGRRGVGGRADPRHPAPDRARRRAHDLGRRRLLSDARLERDSS